MSRNKFIAVSDFGHVLVSGPLFDWLTEQNSNVVSLPWVPTEQSDSSVITRSFEYLRWHMVLFFDSNKRARQAWRLEPAGELPNDQVMAYIDENFP
jgi:hypothetical protein